MPDKDHAMALLRAEVANAGDGGKASVAVRLGISRCYLSRVLSPNDTCEASEKLLGRIIDRFDVIPECPATGLPQPRHECLRLCRGKAPTHNPLSMRIWKIGQTCPNKPQEDRS